MTAQNGSAPSSWHEAIVRDAERYATLFEAAPIPFVTTDLAGKILDANPAAGDCLQIEPRFLVGKPIVSFVVAEDRRPFRTWMLEQSRRGVPGVTSVRMERRSHIAFDAEVRLTPGVEELVWAFLDVTEERTAEGLVWELNRDLEARVAARARDLHALHEDLPLAVTIVDVETRAVRSANRRAREILGPTGSAADLLWPVDRVLDGERLVREVRRIQTDDERRLDLELTAVPLRDGEGNMDAVAFVFDEVSHLLRREAADARFVDNAAHQLRTPITAIAIAAAALQAGAQDDPAERERFVGHITRESDRMARVIDALLGLARVQRSGAGLLMAIVPLAPLLDDIVAETPLRDQVEVIVECPSNTAVVGDGSMLREAFANVIRNAAAHTTSGSIRIAGRTNADKVIVDVADSGPGIPEEEREHIFERFFRGHGGGRDGAGLGLAVAAEAVQVNGGSLELVESGNGATFRFTLPGAKLL